MIYGGGTYGVTSFFEQEQSLPVFTTTRLFIPWETGDFDLDGTTDLLAVDARRVRVLEPSSQGSFPDRVVWETEDVWGGEIADLDGDARPEMILRSATGQLFRVFETDGDNSFAETAALVNDTPGENEMGDRQSVGDLNGDGRGEWISGDNDGDLIIFKSVGNDAYRHIWSDVLATADIDGRLLSPVADLDGDGQNEFISGRLTQDPFDVEGRRWTLSVYGAKGDNDYGIEWQTQIAAGSASGNGITVIDLDGDGRLEWVAALVPHLFIFQSDGDGGYAPVWHTQIRRTQRPASGDVDGDGRQELSYNRAAGGLQTVGWRVAAAPLFAPTGWAAVPAGPSRARLTWERVPGAAAYHLRRNGEVVARISDTADPSYTHVDTGLTTGQPYAYDMVAVDTTGAMGHNTHTQSVIPGKLPAVVAVRRSSAQQLAIDFDQPMSDATAESFRYTLQPEVSTAEAVIFDRSRRRAIVAFASILPEEGNVSLHFAGLRSAAGAPLEVDSTAVQLAPLFAAARLRQVMVVSPFVIAALFDRPVSVGRATVHIDDGAIGVEGVRVRDADGAVEIRLSPATPLRPLGRDYEVVLAGLMDDLGRSFSARAFVTLQAAQLDELLVFPNPVDPIVQDLSVAGLPSGTRVRIHTLGGELVWSGEETDGDGGLQWNGRNAAGAPVAAGVYLLLATHEGRTRYCRVAVLPHR
ncbi:MAG: VCBS repeat-containing protein, partial [bacterium]|nr:VCBS repeat-containing protein [bacterium]